MENAFDLMVAKHKFFSVEEFKAALEELRKGKATDDQCLVAAMLKHSSEELWKTPARMYNEILKQGAALPDTWRTTTIHVIFKKGGPKRADNYRPISIIPLLYTTFSKLPLDGIRQTLEKHKDQNKLDSEQHSVAMTICK